MKKRTIELNEEDARILLSLLDLAVKSGGLIVAQNAVRIAGMVQEAFNREEGYAPVP